MKKHLLLLLLLFLCIPFSLWSQVDTSRFVVMMDSITYYGDNKDHVKAISLLDIYIVESRRANYREGVIEGYLEKARRQIQMSALDVADSTYHLAISEANANDDHLSLGKIYHQKANLSKKQGEAYKAVEHFESAIEQYKLISSDYELCAEYVDYAHHLSNLSDYNGALEYFDLAYQTCQSANDENYINYALQGTGIVYARMKEYELADSFYLRVLNKYDETEHMRFKAILMNRAILMKNRKQYEEAMALYNKLMDTDPGRKGSGVTGVLINRAELYLMLDKPKLAYDDANDALKNMIGFRNWSGATVANTILGDALMGMGQPRKAISVLQEGLEYAQKASSLDRYMDNYEMQVEAYEAVGDSKNALLAHKQYVLYRDSLFNIEKADKEQLYIQKFANTLEKTENALLKSELNVSQAKRTRLWVSLGAISLIGLGGILFLNYRSRKERSLFETTKELQDQKIKNEKLEKDRLKKDLNLKKQELMASALQIQNKNEVLAKLNTQIAEIGSGGHENNFILKKLARQIDMDLESKSEWDLFIQSFSEVHIDFVNRLNREHTDLTRHQIRLLCLMKMNLSSLEIGNILNISSEGVKKARYRVKKKLGLTTEDKIEDFLNDFVGTEVLN